MGVKKVLKYTAGMAIAGIAGYEIARLHCKTHGFREGGTENIREERWERAVSEPKGQRDYRSIYNL